MKNKFDFVPGDKWSCGIWGFSPHPLPPKALSDKEVEEKKLRKEKEESRV